MNTTMLIHPTVIHAITGTLRNYGVREQEIEDGVAEVQTRTLEYLEGRPHPASLAEWAALCVTVAKHWRMDENEKLKTQRKYCVGLCEDPDAHGGLERAGTQPDAVDAGRMMEVLRDQFEAGEMPDKGEEILDCVQAGMDYQETAAELGISAEAVRKRLKRMRELFKGRLGALGMSVMMLVLFMATSAPAMVASATEPTAPWPAVPVPPPRCTPLMRAA
jgi:RNA polymerase sigma factor (sigma-70 family)